jgi:hypothetical protein
VGLEDADSKI